METTIVVLDQSSGIIRDAHQGSPVREQRFRAAFGVSTTIFVDFWVRICVSPRSVPNHLLFELLILKLNAIERVAS